MNRIYLFLIAFVIIVFACNKTVNPTLSYSVTDDANDSAMEDIYIPQGGTYQMNVLVKFLQSPTNQDDNVELVMAGLPSTITVSPDTFNAVPNYTATFTFSDTSASLGVYPVTITAHTRNGLPQVHAFNVHVIPADCAAMYWGNLTGSSACTSRSFTHIAVGSTGGTNVLQVNNFGGYGTACTVTVNLNCDNNTLSIANGNYGNGVVMRGSGVFNADSMTINYAASATPTGGAESCTVIYKLQ